jgi:hypothetical protein
MQRIRTVKPELFRHEGLFEAEQDFKLPLRLAFIGIFTCCDREGRFRWRPKQLKLDVFPYDDDLDMEHVLDALVTRGFIAKYACGGEIYGCIPSWHRHQQINNRESSSVLPGSDRNSAVSESDKNDASSSCDLHVDSTPGERTCMHQGKGKGKGTEREGEKEVEGNTRDTRLMARQSHDPSALMLIFEHWKKVMELPKAVLDSRRRESITHALAMGYTTDQLCNAIDGCSHTPHNMGKNEQGQRYDGLHIIFRDADQIDRFIRNLYQPPRPMHLGEKRTQLSVQNLQNWLDKKTNKQDELESEMWEEKNEGE